MEFRHRFISTPSRSVARGRYAPSPTGKLHVGNARTALVAWLSCRQRGGRFVWRLEDLDTPRVAPGMAEQAETDLQWLGLDWDEGPGIGGPYGPYIQSERHAIYDHALSVLHERDFLFPCTYSRKDLESLSSAPHGPERSAPYPLSLRPAALEDAWFEQFCRETPEVNIRFKVSPGIEAFEDRVLGRQQENVAEAVGDFVVRRRDGMYAYQLAVVVDDLTMHVSEVVRGADLLASTGRQIQLIRALGGEPPAYAHIPLVRNADGEKLSKRDAGLTLEALRDAGAAPEQLVGSFLYSLGLIPKPRLCSAADAVALLDWGRIPSQDWRLPPDYVDEVIRIT